MNLRVTIVVKGTFRIAVDSRQGKMDFLQNTFSCDRGGVHAMLRVEKHQGLPVYSVPLAFRSPLICRRQESARFSSLFASENIISPAFATIPRPRMLRSSLGLSWALQEWPSPLVGGIGERQPSNELLLLASALALVSIEAHALADGPACAIVKQTPDGFLNLRADFSMSGKIIAKLRPGDSALCHRDRAWHFNSGRLGGSSRRLAIRQRRHLEAVA